MLPGSSLHVDRLLASGYRQVLVLAQALSLVDEASLVV